MKPRLLASIAFGATALLGGVALAEPTIATFLLHNDMKAGALWRNDRANNHDTRGAGAEHPKITVLKDGRILLVATASYTDVVPTVPNAGFSSVQAKLEDPSDGDPGVQPRGARVQALCAAYQLDPQQGLVKVNMAYFTDNDSPDWQNGNKPTISPINGGTAALALYGYDPNGNRTRIYGRVLGPSCELLSAQTQLFADNNDDYGGLYDVGDPTVTDTGCDTKTCLGWIGNRFDHWAPSGAVSVIRTSVVRSETWIGSETAPTSSPAGAASVTLKPLGASTFTAVAAAGCDVTSYSQLVAASSSRIVSVGLGIGRVSV